jgi:hypothetical protein
MILYNLTPLLRHHYRTFFTTTGQSVSDYNIGILPLGWAYCVFPFAFITRFPSSVFEPLYKSCHLKHDSHTESKQVISVFSAVKHRFSIRIILCSFWLEVPTFRLLISGSPRRRINSYTNTCYPRGITFPNRSIPWLFTKAPLGGLTLSPVKQNRWVNPIKSFHHLKYSMQNILLPMFYFLAHYEA